MYTTCTNLVVIIPLKIVQRCELTICKSEVCTDFSCFLKGFFYMLIIFYKNRCHYQEKKAKIKYNQEKLRRWTMINNKNNNLKAIDKALQYCRRNLDNSEITVEQVADKMGFSTNHFNCLFKEHTGFSVMKYIRFERLRKAAILLRTTQKEILEIALECGYTTHESFCRAYKEQYECTPKEYRQKKRNQALNWADMTDVTHVQRFLKQYPEFKRLDEDKLIDALLSKDAKRFGYLCISIQEMGLKAVTNQESWEEGFVLIGDKRNPANEYYLVLVSDNYTIMRQWYSKLEFVQELQTGNMDVVRELQANNYVAYTGVVECRQYMYLGEPIEVTLPDEIEIHKLTSKDKEQIRLWAGNKKDGYTKHLLQLEKYEQDDKVLEFGLFEKGNMIAAIGCGISSVRGFIINDCIQIRFAKGKEGNELYRKAFLYVTNEIVKKGILPFDNIQYGEYAKKHGGFTSEAMGYQFVHASWFV